MPPDSASAVVLLAVALWLVRDRRSFDATRRWARFAAALAVAIGLLALAEDAFDWNDGLGSVFDGETPGAANGAMSPHAATMIIAIGFWLIALDRPGRRWTLAVDLLAAVSGLVVLVAVIGSVYGADFIYGYTGVAGVSPQTVVAAAALFIGLLAARPDSPWMRLVLSTGTGGHVMRRLIPALIVLPVLVGGLLISAVEQGAISVTLGVAIAIAVLTTALLGILVLISRELERADAERRNLQARLVELADRDPLTDVFNRRRLDEELGRQLALAQRTGSRLGVLSIDLDDFKAVNDSHGHAVGDELLLATAEVLRRELRGSDFVCRPGGDEFIVLLPDSDEKTVRIVAAKLVGAFREVIRVTPDDNTIELHASIGVAISNGDERTDGQELLGAADRALYMAKQGGGDRLAVHGSLVLD